MKTKTEIAKELNVRESNLIWSKKCINSETIYKSDIGTVRGNLGYWVVK